jgi:hypothetical protein
MAFVYILQSEATKRFYVGSTDNQPIKTTATDQNPHPLHKRQRVGHPKLLSLDLRVNRLSGIIRRRSVQLWKPPREPEGWATRLSKAC